MDLGDPRVQAAIIALLSAIIVAVANIVYNIWADNKRHQRNLKIEELRHTANLAIEQKRHEESLMIASLGRFEGGSQKRSVGIAALEVMRKNPEAWKKYRETIKELYFAQVLYLFVHGNNRWESHEITNIISMMEWLIDPQYLGPVDSSSSERLKRAMEKYEPDYDKLKRLPEKDRPKDFRPDDNSVKHIINKMEEWKAKLP